MKEAIKNSMKARRMTEHDLVNSLYVIKGLAEDQLNDASRDDGSQKEKLNEAHGALSRAMNQANKVIEMIQYFRSMAFSGYTGSSEMYATSVQESVQQVVRAMSYEFPFRNITILKIIPHNLPAVPVSREHLDAILFQLVYNARRAIGEQNGIITIEADEKMYLTPENIHKRHFRLRVSDTAPAIPEQQLPHIFDPFFSTVENGNGFGLYIVKKLVELNRGTIRVECSEKGNSFFLDFSA